MITIFWIYGVSNFLNDVEFMLGKKPSWYWRFCWAFITPVLMIVILAYTVITYEPPTYDGVPFPAYAYGNSLTKPTSIFLQKTPFPKFNECPSHS